MSLLADLALATLFGILAGVGLCLAASVVPRIGAPGLAARIAPYVRDVTDPRGTSILPVVAIIDPRGWWRVLRDAVAGRLGGSPSITRRLAQAGRPVDPAGFRARQLTWTAGGLAAGGAVVVVLAVTGTATVPAALLPVVGALLGTVACDVQLTRAAKARIARLEEELPVALEFLALCLAAGEGMLDALRRVGDAGAGELTAELRAVVLEVGTGAGLAEALAAMSARLRIPALTRAVDHLVAALDRGAPLAHVLQAQAADARDDARRSLLESAGRKEIAMLLPLVFLILPLSVLFAIFPGVHLLRLGMG